MGAAAEKQVKLTVLNGGNKIPSNLMSISERGIYTLVFGENPDDNHRARKRKVRMWMKHVGLVPRFKLGNDLLVLKYEYEIAFEQWKQKALNP